MNESRKYRLLQRIGYQFRNQDLLVAALTHRSVGRINNERLEFLGDSILSFVVADMLYQQFPDIDEGKLSRLRSLLVKGDNLAKIARSLELGECIQLGGGEIKSGGHRRSSILADALEALIGAVYVDSDETNARAVIERLLGEQIDSLSPKMALKDGKTRLQELMQGRHLALPEYDVISVQGEAHCQQFTICCKVENLPDAVCAQGSSRRKAEQAAALQTLELLAQQGIKE